MIIKKNIVLAQYTTFHIGGKAKYFADVKSVEELKKAVDFGRKKKLKIFVLGGGSNVLLPDKGLNGLLLKVSIKGVTFLDNKEHKNSEHVFLSAGAGEEWDKIVAQVVAKNLSGIENLSLIPGSVGGAVYQNIGAYGVELKDVVESVEVFDLKSGSSKTLSNKNCHFGYRTSVFQQPLGKKYIITRVVLKLSKKYTPNITYPDLMKRFEGKNPSITEVRKAVVEIRRLKLDYPSANIGTVGSFFKNPAIPVTSYQLLATSYPDIRGRDLGNGLVKLSAGQLIEKAGWKGKRFGNVGVSDRHALVLISYKGGKASEIVGLASKISNDIKVKFGVFFKPEVHIIE